MRTRTLCAAFTALVLARRGLADALPEERTRQLTDTIRRHCPEARITVTQEGFTAKYGTIVYTLHNRAKTGGVFEQTYREEGPNYRGFVLQVSRQHGKYGGAAVVPQTLQGPYFPTFIDAVPTEDGRAFYQVHFAYGSRLDPALMKAIFAVVPKSRAVPRQSSRNR